ncbi:glycosyltransferase [Parasediminibacterium sp. JCM 36343]|uniref:glycosyltransferase n=1 Tax=Parasediminibacterium sp. JCM 36343 TaxID=3374279 RepID=UPI003979B209
MPRILLTVTNDLTYDQRMQRICTSLSQAGYETVLIGRKLNNSTDLKLQSFAQKRLYCFFSKGILFYTEYNLRLFIYLLFAKADAFCAIDLDTIMPCYLASTIRKKKRIYDAHELFTEQKEIVTRPLIHKVWLAIERFAVPRFRHGYTVNFFIKQELNRRYAADYEIVRNLPTQQTLAKVEKFATPTLIYQGAVNEGRSFETLIPAMKQINATLLICGVGNFLTQAMELAKEHAVEDKVIFKGAVAPAALQPLTQQCHIGMMLFEDTGLNQYYSLANRFFDYMMAGIPQVCVGYPEYAAIIKDHPFAYLIHNTREETIAVAVNKLLQNNVLYNELEKNAINASGILNWGQEEKKLIAFWKAVFEN